VMARDYQTTRANGGVVVDDDTENPL